MFGSLWSRLLPRAWFWSGAGLRFAPIVDGKVIPHSLDGLEAGGYADVPVLTGLTADAGSAMTMDYGKATPEAFAQRLQAAFGAQAAQAAGLYPAVDTEQAGQSAKDVIRERGIAAAWLWARNRAGNGSRQPVYLYLFAHPEPGPDAARFGAFHSAELPYVFQTLDKSPERPFTDIDRKLSENLAGYWVNFVRSGDPNGPGLPQWPVLDPAAPQLLRFGPEPQVQPLMTPEKLSLYVSYTEAGGRLGLF